MQTLDLNPDVNLDNWAFSSASMQTESSIDIGRQNPLKHTVMKCTTNLAFVGTFYVTVMYFLSL